MEQRVGEAGDREEELGGERKPEDATEGGDGELVAGPSWATAMAEEEGGNGVERGRGEGGSRGREGLGEEELRWGVAIARGSGRPEMSWRRRRWAGTARGGAGWSRPAGREGGEGAERRRGRPGGGRRGREREE